MTTGASARSRSTVIAGILITVILVWLRIVYYQNAGALWRDEVNSVNVAVLPSFGEVLANSHLDSFPMAWTALLHAWILAGFGDTDSALRGVGLIVSLALLVALWWSGRRLGAHAPLVTLTIFALSPTAIIYGGQVRGYGLGALAIALCVGAVWSFVEKTTWPRYAVAQATAILAAQSYFGNCFLLVAICAGAAMVSVRRRSWGLLAAIAGLGVVAALSMLINLPSVLYAARLAPIEQGSFGLLWYADVFGHALAPGIPLLAALWAVAACTAVVGCILPWTSFGSSLGEDAKERAVFCLTISLVGITAYAAYTSFISVRTQFWYYLPLMTMLALASDAGIQLVIRRIRSASWLQLATTCLAVALVANQVAATVAVRMTNLDGIAAKISQMASSDDLVVVFPWYCGITVERYYHGPAPWITIPDFAQHKFHLHTLVAEKMKQGSDAVAPELQRVETTLRRGGRVWVVGRLTAPAPGKPLLPLPRWPNGPEGQRASPYLTAWELSLGELLHDHAVDTFQIDDGGEGSVNLWERLPLLYSMGWR